MLNRKLCTLAFIVMGLGTMSFPAFSSDGSTQMDNIQYDYSTPKQNEAQAKADIVIREDESGRLVAYDQYGNELDVNVIMEPSTVKAAQVTAEAFKSSGVKEDMPLSQVTYDMSSEERNEIVISAIQNLDGTDMMTLVPASIAMVDAVPYSVTFTTDATEDMQFRSKMKYIFVTEDEDGNVVGHDEYGNVVDLSTVDMLQDYIEEDMYTKFYSDMTVPLEQFVILPANEIVLDSVESDEYKAEDMKTITPVTYAITDRSGNCCCSCGK